MHRSPLGQISRSRDVATDWLHVNRLSSRSTCRTSNGQGHNQSSAGRTRTYNQWINSPAPVVQPVSLDTAQCDSVCRFAAFVLPGYVRCGLVRLHKWLQPPRCVHQKQRQRCELRQVTRSRGLMTAHGKCECGWRALMRGRMGSTGLGFSYFNPPGRPSPRRRPSERWSPPPSGRTGRSRVGCSPW